MPYLLFLKKLQNLQLSFAANYRWLFKGYFSDFSKKALFWDNDSDTGNITFNCSCGEQRKMLYFFG